MSRRQQGEASPPVCRPDAQPGTTSASADAAAAAPHDIVALYRDHERRILRYCLRHLGNQADAEDATQETFARAVVRLCGVSGDPAAYLSAIARNVCCDALSARRRHDRVETALDSLDRADVGPGPEQTTAERSVLLRALHALSGRERDMLLHRFAGYSYEETAERLGLSVKVVSVTIVRARQRVRHIATAGLTALGSGLGLRRLHAWMARQAVSAASRLRPDRLATAQDAALAVGSLVVLAMVGAPPAAALPSVQPPAVHHLVGQPAPPGTALRTDDTDRMRPDASAEVMAAASRPQFVPAGAAGEAPPPPALPWLATDQAQMRFFSFSTSPDYASDGTVFAAGTINACAGAECSVVFRSRDRGATWQKFSTLGQYQYGPVLVLPSYASDHSIFAATSIGLQRTQGDGSTFQVVAPIPDAVGAAVNAGAAGEQILVGSTDAQSTTWLFSPATNTTVPGPLLPGGMVPDDMAPLGDGSSVMVVARALPVAVTGTAPTATELIVCTAASCARPAGSTQVVQMDGRVTVHVSPTFATDRTVVVASADAVYVSTDGGATLHAVRTVLNGSVSALAMAPLSTTSSSITMAQEISIPDTTASLLQSVDGGASFTALPGQEWTSVHEISALDWLPDGRLLAAVDGAADQRNGVRCSADGGRTWATHC